MMKLKKMVNYLGVGVNIFTLIGMILLIIGAIWLFILFLTGNPISGWPMWFVAIGVLLFIIGIIIIMGSYGYKYVKKDPITEEPVIVKKGVRYEFDD